MQIPSYLQSIHHDGSARYVSDPYPRLGDIVTLRLRTAPDAPIQQILLRTLPDGEQAWTPLTPQPPEAAHRWWTVPLVVSMPTMTYRFALLTDDGLWTYNGVGLHEYTPTDYHDFRLLAEYDPPRWIDRSVFYQIFPDRFADGDPSNNVQTGEWVYCDCPVQARGWNEPPGQSNPSLEFYGGDLQGIAKRLPYLQDLGVNALYLNPIFTAPSVHRYDVTNYTSVDPHLGGNEALADLRLATAERDMRIMLDIVPNHCGVEHPWFQDAQANTASAWLDHFIFNEHPHNYVSWLNVKTLPKLDYRSTALRDAMYAAPDSVFRRWLQPPYSIDGWRVDVANMLGQHGATQIGDEVARGIRSAVKAENPDAYLISENFFDATNQLQGDQYDGNMNYRGFTVPLWDWLNEHRQRHAAFGVETNLGVALSAGGTASAWAAFRAPVPWAIMRQQFTLIDSHDTARIRTLVGGNDALHRLAAVLQFTYPGVPCVYYGDEIGLEAEHANAARQTMPWDEAQWDHDLRRFYQQVIALRRTSSALIDGGFQLLHTDADAIAFLRDTDEQQIIVVGYRGRETRSAQHLPVAHGAIADGTVFRELFSGGSATVIDGVLPLPPMQQGAAIWMSAHDLDRVS